jgi:uncharacterized membrane protein YhdT
MNEGRPTISRWLFEKGVVTIIVMILIYCIGSFFNIVPQPMKDFLTWFDQNTPMIFFAICFLAACFVVVKVKGKKKAENVE